LDNIAGFAAIQQNGTGNPVQAWFIALEEQIVKVAFTRHHPFDEFLIA
jgi:hypothetical protein